MTSSPTNASTCPCSMLESCDERLNISIRSWQFEFTFRTLANETKHYKHTASLSVTMQSKNEIVINTSKCSIIALIQCWDSTHILKVNHIITNTCWWGQKSVTWDDRSQNVFWQLKIYCLSHHRKMIDEHAV